MNYLQRLCILVIQLLSAMMIQASLFTAEPVDTTKAIADEQVRLRIAKTSADSIAPLYNIYDLRIGSQNAYHTMWKLYDVAGRAGDVATRLDMIRNLANTYLNDDSVLTMLERDVLREPTSNEQKETLLFVRICLEMNKLKFASEKEREAMLSEKIKTLANPREQDVYDKVLEMFSLVKLLSGETQGDLLGKYIEILGGLIDKLPLGIEGIRNKYYSLAAIAYTSSGNTQGAANADRELLAIIKEMRSRYLSEGRPYRTLDRNRYISMRRLLYNYQALSEKEVDDYYSQIKQLAASDRSLGFDFNHYKRPTIFYLMARKQYDEALPLLKEQVEAWKNHPIPSNDDFYLRRLMMAQLRKAALEVGDEKTLLEQTNAYNQMLEDYIAYKTAERYKELEIIYEVNNLRASNADLELQRKNSIVKDYRIGLVVGGVALMVVIVLALVLLRLYRRADSLAKELSESAKKVMEERDALASTQRDLIVARDNANAAERQKEEFISNMSHEVTNPLRTIVEYSQMIVDCIDDSKRPYLQKFAKILTLNADLLQTTFNDILNLSLADSQGLTLSIQPASINQICEMAVESSRTRLNPGVTMTYLQENNPDRTILTDSHRVEMVLVNLLQNSAKFTAEGSITLSYTVDEDASTVTFAVTDTGIGIPKGEEERIFERFRKLDKYSQGIGLGLPVCKLFAKMLKGDIRVDTSYGPPGSRFLFTIPR